MNLRGQMRAQPTPRSPGQESDADRFYGRDADIVQVAERVRRRCRFLLVDEFQDTNHAQLELVHALVRDGGKLTAVGDEDQSIRDAA